MWALGAFSKPRELLEQWRHRVGFMKLQKSLFYHRYASAVLLAHEVGIFDALKDGPLSFQQVGSKCQIHPRSAEALVRIVESQGLAKRRAEGYELSKFAEAYLTRTSRFSLSPMLELMTAQSLAFADLPQAVRDGSIPGVLDIFSDEGRYQAFLDAVNAYLDWAVRDLLHRVELPDIKTFIVGSMGVSFSALLLERFPNAKVTYGCLEHLVREIPRLRETYRVPPNQVTGMHNHSGEPSDDRWGEESYDLIFLTKKMILDPENRMGEKFVRKAFDVLTPGGVAILWETIHSDAKATSLAQAMEAVMDLGASPTGLVHTDVRLRSLLHRIGYDDVQFVPCLSRQTTFVVARKPSHG